MTFHFSYQIQAWLGIEFAEVNEKGNSVREYLDLWLEGNPEIHEQIIKKHLVREGVYQFMFIRKGKILGNDDTVGEEDEIDVNVLLHGG